MSSEPRVDSREPGALVVELKANTREVGVEHGEPTRAGRTKHYREQSDQLWF